MVELNNAEISIDAPQGAVKISGASPVSRLCVRADAGRLTVVTSREEKASTTVLLAMMGLWPIEEGFAAIDGELLTPKTRRVFGHRFCYVPRDVAMEGVSLAQIVATLNGKSHAGESNNELRLTQVELDHLHIDHKIMASDFKALPSAMRRLLMMAAAIGTERPILVADGPTEGVDNEHRQLIANRLKELAADGRTVIVGTTDEQIVALADAKYELRIKN